MSLTESEMIRVMWAALLFECDRGRKPSVDELRALYNRQEVGRGKPVVESSKKWWEVWK